MILSIHISHHFLNSIIYSKTSLFFHVSGSVALHYAASNGHLECVAALVRVTPCDIINKKDETPVHAACYEGHKHVIEYLHSKGWNLGIANTDGITELDLSALYGHLDVVKYLVEAKLNPNQYNKLRHTSLGYAVHNGHLNIVSWLMKREGGSSQRPLHAPELLVCILSFVLLLNMFVGRGLIWSILVRTCNSLSW